VLKLGTALPILEMIYSVAVNYWTDQYLGYLIVYRTIVNNTICFKDLLLGLNIDDY